MSDAEHPGWVLLLCRPEVVSGLSVQAGQAVAGSGAVVHGSNGGPGPGGHEPPYILVLWVLHRGGHFVGCWWMASDSALWGHGGRES